MDSMEQREEQNRSQPDSARQMTLVQGIDQAPQAARLREQVFLREQGFHTEFDEIDPIAWHLALLRQGQAIAVGRLYPTPGQPEIFHIGRVAVRQDCRGQGLGQTVVLELEQKARQLGARMIQLSAQCHAQGFYEKLGYTAHGEIYLDEHCPHIDMQKPL